MEAPQHKDLRVYIREDKPAASTAVSPSIESQLSLSDTSSDSEDEHTTVQFKLAAALEAATAQANGLSIDWESIKAALIAEAEAAYKADSDGTENASVIEKPCGSAKSDCPSYDSLRLEKSEALPVKRLEAATGTRLRDNHPFVAAPETGLSVTEAKNPIKALDKILSRPAFDPMAPQLQVHLFVKSTISMSQLSLRDNVIEVEIKKSLLKDYANGEFKKHELTLSPFMNDLTYMHVKHTNEEFLTFCSCNKCLDYREIVNHVMEEQVKISHMVELLLECIRNHYKPFLRNETAIETYKKLTADNQDIHWIACGFVYNKKAEHLELIHDTSLTDNMIIVLFSSILMVNNPLLLLQILAFQMECFVKAYVEGFLEIVQPDRNAPAEDMLTYILEGYNTLMYLSERLSCFLFAFENDFLQKFSLTWTLLCQRLYQQHVYLNLTDTMLACIITIKEQDLTTQHAGLIRAYIKFDDEMHTIDKRWSEVWVELNKFNLSATERKRRTFLHEVHSIYDAIAKDAVALCPPVTKPIESQDQDGFEWNGLAWQQLMAFVKKRWPNGFFKAPNTLVCENHCQRCSAVLDYHSDSCKCITCSIAGGPTPIIREPENTCDKCLAELLAEKEGQLYESKIVNICANDDLLSNGNRKRKRKSASLEQIEEELFKEHPKNPISTDGGEYHLGWAVFQHLKRRKRYIFKSIKAKYFCHDCSEAECIVARGILNEEVEPSLASNLIQYYHPISMKHEDIRAILPNITMYNRKMIATNSLLELTDVNDFIVKIYWTFIISLYATYFMDLDSKKPANLSNLELYNNDIRVRESDLVDKGNDRKFLNFLEQIKRTTPPQSATTKLSMQPENAKVVVEKKPLPNDKAAAPVANATQTTQTPPAADTNNKKANKDKKKCCYEHPELAEHCKETHTKKRIKKECNHARMNETRDRLRKKLSQMASARNTGTTAGTPNAAAAPAAPLTPSAPTNVATNSPAKPAPTNAGQSAVKPMKAVKKDEAENGGANSLDCLNSLCKSITHTHTCGESPKANVTPPPNPYTAPPQPSQTAPAARAAQVAPEAGVPLTTQNVKRAQAQTSQINTEPPNPYSNPPSYTSSLASSCSLAGDVREEEDESKLKQWVKERLMFIEGGTLGKDPSKKQPQTTNPKKAAKKAKQKLRKEEEKRICELHDLRGQFHDIYFKEFADKQQLKAEKANKKRDKKRITELEANIKKLQKAKARVEAAILEQIATVKQTNTEFKFSYLPTKEQQQQKMQALEANENEGEMLLQTMDEPVVQQPQSVPHHNAHMPIPMMPAGSNNLNGTFATPVNCFVPYHVPYGYPMNFPPQQVVAGPPFGLIRPPMFYAPPPQPMAPHAMQPPPMSSQPMPQMPTNPPPPPSNAAGQDPSKRIVTIRRVNLPNVPDPQVTVTAKGTSPDKDKLLYTFVNGQLVHTTAPQQISMNFAPMAMAPPMPAQNVAMPPAASGLSKTQLKKERRRLAAQMAELEAPAQKTEDFYTENMKALGEIEGHGLKQSKKEKQEFDAMVTATVAALKKRKKLQKHVVTPSSSTTSMSNSEANEAVPKFNPQANVAPPPRSTSTTSCSARTSPSLTAVSSQIETRDNSECSIGAQAAAASNPKKAAKQAKQKQPPQNQPKQAQKDKQQKTTSKKVVAPKPIPEVPAPVAVPIEKPKKEKVQREKFVDNGQLDNNPYKSLHLQDSDTENETSSSFAGSMSGSREEIARPQQQQPMPVATAKPAPPVKQSAQKREVSNKVPDKAPAGSNKAEKKPPSQKAEQARPAQKVPRAEPIVQATKINAVKQSTKQEKQPPPRQPKTQHAPPNKPQMQTQQETRRKSQAGAQYGNQKTPQQSTRFERNANSRNNPAHRASTRNAPQKQSDPPKEPPQGLSKRAQKQLQRSKGKQHSTAAAGHYDDSSLTSGIPNNMGYFNVDDVAMPAANKKQHQQYGRLTQQMQQLRLDGADTQPSYSSVIGSQHAAGQKAASASNVSIMDQLNRGVQVENLSLPPGITLTKVDPIKSEQLRQKSESIKKVIKPMQPPQPDHSHTFQQPNATIIAPPIGAASSYYGAAPYAGVAAGAAMDRSGIIMVEANPTSGGAKPANVAAANKANVAAAAANSKTSKSKKRRNKQKSEAGPSVSSGASSGAISEVEHAAQTGTTVTLRNPMFHGANVAASATMMPPPNLSTNRPLGGLPMAAPLSADTPAAIIKNDNGMFTIRSPALHQAVTNGLYGGGGYRQFGNVNYYTPQEAAAEAVKAMEGTHGSAAKRENANSSPFSYFSTPASEVKSQPVEPTANNTHNTISISCTSVDNQDAALNEDSALLSTAPHPPPKCISAIGSEKKNAQKQKCQSQWSNFGQEETRCGGSSYLSGDGSSGSGALNTFLQDKYQQSAYYNGFDVFSVNKQSSQLSGGGATLFEHHSCGDDSPPPTITGYNSYLEGIPNCTGIIRYDDAAYLKNLIPGQNLNNEVSIHNVKDSNFARNASSPVAHRVEITPVYPNRTNLYEAGSTQASDLHNSYAKESISSYRDGLGDFRSDSMFSGNNVLNLSELETSNERSIDTFGGFGYDFETPCAAAGEQQKNVLDLNDIFMKSSTNDNSHTTSPFLEESNPLENFVQNMNSLSLSASTDEQRSQRDGTSTNGNSSAANVNANRSTTDVWW